MALNDYVQIVITRDSIGITAPGFGTPLILGYGATWGDRVRYYNDLPGMVTDGFTTDSPEYLAAQAILSQSPQVERFAVGRGSLPPTQVYKLGVQSVGALTLYSVDVKGKGVTATTCSYMTPSGDLTFTAANATEIFTSVAHGMATGDGPYRVSNAGGGLPTGLAVDTNYWIYVLTADTYKLATTKTLALAATPDVAISTDGTGTQTLRRVQNDVICAQLVQALNAVVGKNYTAVQTAGTGETDYLTITASTAGAWFSLAINNPALLNNTQTQVDPGIATDLAAIVTEQPDWYGLVTCFNSQLCVVAAAGWVETAGRIYTPSVTDTLALTTTGGAGGSSDTLDALHTLNYSRTLASYHRIPAEFMGAAWMGKMLPLDPGSATWKFKSLLGVSFMVFTPTQKTNLLSRKGNSCESLSGLSVTFEGTSADGEFLDAIVGDDWVTANMQAAVFNVLATAPTKVEQEDSGYAKLEAAIRDILKQAVDRKIYAKKPAFTITVPLAADASSSDKSTRTASGIKWAATRSGAIHKAKVQGTVSL